MTPGANEPIQGGTNTLLKGPMMLSAVITERGTDEGCEAAAKLLRVAADTFFRRPSLKDLALQHICEFMNSRMCLLQGQFGRIGCDTAILMHLRNQVRWFTCGDSRVFHFVNGRLAHASDPEPAPLMGQKPDYHVRLEPIIDLGQEDNAFLLCSPVLAAKLDTAAMERTLAASHSPEEWMNALVAEAGEEQQFCATTLMMPRRKKRMPLWIPLAALAAAALAWLFLR